MVIESRARTGKVFESECKQRMNERSVGQEDVTVNFTCAKMTIEAAAGAAGTSADVSASAGVAAAATARHFQRFSALTIVDAAVKLLLASFQELNSACCAASALALAISLINVIQCPYLYVCDCFRVCVQGCECTGTSVPVYECISVSAQRSVAKYESIKINVIFIVWHQKLRQEALRSLQGSSQSSRVSTPEEDISQIIPLSRIRRFWP